MHVDSRLIAIRFDYDNVPRQGNRVVSLGEKPYLDPSSLSRREALDSANITHE